MPEKRVFSEQEVSQILKRAVQIMEKDAAQSYTPGITEEELAKIANEVGVPPDALRRAILESGDQSEKKGPFHLTEEFERVVEGELDPSQFDILTEGIKPLSKNGQMHMAQVGRMLSMSAWTGVGQAKIDVTSRNGRTRLKVKSNAIFQFLMTLHPSLMISIVTLASMSEHGMGWLGAAIGAGVMSIGGLLFGKLTKLGHRRAEKLADDLRARIAETLEYEKAKQPGSTVTQVEEQKNLEQRLGQG